MINSISPETMMLIIQICAVALIITSLIVSVLFILSQQKLAKALVTINSGEQIHPAWLWTQLIPIWSYIALVVTAVKLDEQTKLYNQTHEKKLKFKASLVYWYVGLTLLNVIPVINIIVGIATIVIFIIIWANITKSTKVITAK
ncbi:hypothetical protein IBE48_05690 [Francisella philomiragia]|uniref:Membrane protein n=1 Tax=Francisella philomiragia TaxID=28110 RepID=A0AAW3DC27_9GAMM|nr:hypothetical protein [Francisella philomiragia]KFJ43609.1 putative membrane protein [Francisella philomiragia]MBK2255275.1 hypothetical protein [Francisella philomiragia]MBK2273557.1 hypothetical protein [Francisella philomiragia]MBK2277225.1 hypothetical protein [Francisella philomiragia]MBK2281144.1 hypothetical protein [Francisella philomiragia]